MARSKESNFVIESKSARYITHLCNLSEKTQAEIAAEVGFEKPNVITMIKQGRIKIPIPRIPALAKALDADPADLLDIVLEESHPEVRKVLLETTGVIVNKEEKEIINLFREVKAEKESIGKDFVFSTGKACVERLRNAIIFCLKEVKIK